jgi:hypothetical protein
MTKTDLLDHAPWSPKMTAAAMAGSGLFLAAGLAVTPWEDQATTAAYLRALAAHPTQGQISAMLLFLGFLMLAPIAIGLLSVTSRRGRVRGAAAFLAIVGGIALPGAIVADFFHLALAQSLSVKEAAEITDKAQGYAACGIISALGMLGMAGLLALLVIAWRRGALPLVTPLLFAAGWIAPIALGVGLGPALVGGALLLAGLGAGAFALNSAGTSVQQRLVGEPVLAGPDQAGLVRQHNGLDTAAQSELLQKSGDM